MKTVTKICICLLVALSILLIPSCAREEFLVAYASDYGGAIEFTSGEFDLDKITAMRYSTSPYFNYSCYVSKNHGYGKREDRLIVSNEWSETIKTIIAGSGWFVGVDYSEFLSGIMYYPSTNGREFGGMEPKMVLGENCVGLFEINNELYAVTCYNSSTEAPTNVSLYRLIYPTKENGLKCYAEKITEIPDVNFADAATVTDDGLIYVVTTEHFYSISTDGTVTNIDVPEEWMYLCKDSIVEVNRDIYVGTHCGILRYEPDMDKFTWFPADYENMIIK